jgi:hypothetical protein
LFFSFLRHGRSLSCSTGSRINGNETEFDEDEVREVGVAEQNKKQNKDNNKQNKNKNKDTEQSKNKNDNDATAERKIQARQLFIPLKIKQRRLSVLNLYTNGLDSPQFNKMHKAQYPVSNTDPKFAEVLNNISIIPSQLLLFQHSGNAPKDEILVRYTSEVPCIGIQFQGSVC